MRKPLDLTNKKFNYLTVTEQMSRDQYGNLLYKCICDCGKETVTRSTYLINGHTKSCGCLRKNGHPKHNHNQKGKVSRTYRIWTGILTRCRNQNSDDYKNYGGRGIKVCERWSNKKNGFINFFKDMGECPDGLTIDRTNNNKGYYKSNCIWTTMKIQQRNRRDNNVLEYNNKKLCIAEWSEVIGIRQGTIKRRLELGWPIEKALTKPIKKHKKYIKK